MLALWNLIANSIEINNWIDAADKFMDIQKLDWCSPRYSHQAIAEAWQWESWEKK